MTSIRQNLAGVREAIARAAARSGRPGDSIGLIAVTKTVAVSSIQEAIAAGITAIGENRVQELLQKYPSLGNGVEWHLIGHLQTNKVKYIVDKVDLIHSLDSLRLAQALSQGAQKARRTLAVLVQVNVANEATKYGLSLGEVIPFIREVASYPALAIRGLMTIAPWTADPEEVRPVFRRLRSLFTEIDQLSIPGVKMEFLSMGMSNDFEVAIEEGANLVRIGSRIFGERG